MTTDIISTPLDLVAAGTGPTTALSETLRRCEETGRSVFLFGGDAVGIRAMRERVARQHPRLRIAGICDADFSGPTGRAILDHIASCRPDVVVVDLPSARHRAMIAEVAAVGLRFIVINRPGSFAGDAKGCNGVATMWPRRMRKAASTLAATMRFAGLVLRQGIRGPGQVREGLAAPRREP